MNACARGLIEQEGCCIPEPAHAAGNNVNMITVGSMVSRCQNGMPINIQSQLVQDVPHDASPILGVEAVAPW